MAGLTKKNGQRDRCNSFLLKCGCECYQSLFSHFQIYSLSNFNFFFLLFGYCTLLVPGKTESWRGAKGRAFETTSLTQDSDKSMTCHGLRKSWMNSQWFKSTCANYCAHLLLRFKLKCFVLYWLWAKGIRTASHQSSYAVNC